MLFGDRLRGVLTNRGGEGTQAWLAHRSGIDPSLLSRILRNERVPTLETLRALAPALEMDIRELVAGTPAETRLAAGGDHVRRSDYEEAVGKVIEFETKIRDLEASGRSLEETLATERKARRHAEEEAKHAQAELERLLAALRELRERWDAQGHELKRYKSALKRALTQFSALKTRVDELQRELGKTRVSSQVGAVLAAVAAVTSVATLAQFLGDEDEAPTAGHARAKTKGPRG